MNIVERLEAENTELAAHVAELEEMVCDLNYEVDELSSVLNEQDTLYRKSQAELFYAIEQIKNLQEIISALKYYGDGLRWFNRVGGYSGTAAPLVKLLDAYEKQFGKVQEMEDTKYMELADLK